MRADLAAAGDALVERLAALDLGDAFDPRAARAIVESGLHRLTVPAEAGGLGASMVEAAEVLARVGAVDGSTGLGFAMQVHVIGAMRDAPGVPDAIRDRVYRAIVEDGALVNNAATEEGGGSPARGAIPGTTARPDDDGTWRLSGEKTWTTWLPNLSPGLRTARIAGDAEPPEVGRFLVDLGSPGVERRDGFEALGMRGSASGRLVLDGVEADARVAERGRRARSARAGDRRLVRGRDRRDLPGHRRGRPDRGRALGARPSPGRRLHERRGPAERPDPARSPRRGAARRAPRAARCGAAVGRRPRPPTDLALAKLVCTRAAVSATDEALRIAGGPGFLAGRLERAFRDARAGLINPPLEDVALAGFAAALLERERGSSNA